jgi:hypothetical protein
VCLAVNGGDGQRPRGISKTHQTNIPITRGIHDWTTAGINVLSVNTSVGG